MNLPMNIRELSARQIVDLLRDVNVTQAMIGRRVRATQSYVSLVISRRAPLKPSKKSERVWREIAKAVNGAAA